MARRLVIRSLPQAYEVIKEMGLSAIELHVPQTRRMSGVEVIRAYGRRGKEIDRMILACFVLGLFHPQGLYYVRKADQEAVKLICTRSATPLAKEKPKALSVGSLKDGSASTLRPSPACWPMKKNCSTSYKT